MNEAKFDHRSSEARHQRDVFERLHVKLFSPVGASLGIQFVVPNDWISRENLEGGLSYWQSPDGSTYLLMLMASKEGSVGIEQLLDQPKREIDAARGQIVTSLLEETCLAVRNGEPRRVACSEIEGNLISGSVLHKVFVFEHGDFIYQIKIGVSRPNVPISDFDRVLVTRMCHEVELLELTRDK